MHAQLCICCKCAHAQLAMLYQHAILLFVCSRRMHAYIARHCRTCMRSTCCASPARHLTVRMHQAYAHIALHRYRCGCGWLATLNQHAIRVARTHMQRHVYYSALPQEHSTPGVLVLCPPLGLLWLSMCERSWFICEQSLLFMLPHTPAIQRAQQRDGCLRLGRVNPWTA